MSEAWLTPDMDMFSRKAVGYMSQCVWNEESYEKNFRDCSEMFGRDDVIAILKAKSLYQKPLIGELGDCFDKIKNILKKYMDMNENNYHIVTLWIIGTYIFDSFNTFPELFINAPKGSGKTRLLLLIESLSWNGKIQANLREAVLFRTKKNHTMLIDEFEQVSNKDMGTMRELINASYKRSSKVERMKEVIKEGKKTYEVESFDLFSPLVMANISGMDETIKDRCITIILDKSDDMIKTRLMEDFKENPEILSVVTTITRLRCRLCRDVSEKKHRVGWNLYVSQLPQTTLTTLTTQTTQTTQTTPNQDIYNNNNNILYNKINEIKIYGRDLELFFPLFIISEMFGNECLERILEISKSYSVLKNQDEFSDNPDIILLDFLNKNFLERGMDYIFMNEILNAYRLLGYGIEDMNSKKLGWALTRLNIILDKKREGSKGAKVILDFIKIKQKLKRYER